jgi:large subunit ribosomal protein L25
MSNEFAITAQLRTAHGRVGSRRLRRTEQVPAIMYGMGHEPMLLSLSHNELSRKLQNEAFYSHILTVNIDGKNHKAVLRDLQRHPSRPKILHADFQSVSDTQRITMHVPLHFINADIAPGVKEQGGVVSHLANSVEVRCLAKELPEYIEADLANLSLNQSLHLSDLKLAAGVQLVALTQGRDIAVVSVHAPQATVEEAAPVAAAAAPAEGAAAAAAPAAEAKAGEAKPEAKGK